MRTYVFIVLYLSRKYEQINIITYLRVSQEKNDFHKNNTYDIIMVKENKDMPDLTNLFNLLEEDGATTGLSKSTGISSGNICDWKNGRSKPNAETLVKIADYFACSVDYLLGRTSVKEFVKIPTSVIQIPIFMQRAAAGIGKESVDDNINPPEQKWFYEDQIPSGTEYGIIIEGDSMEKKFHDNQIVFVKLSDDCPDGSYGIFTITDNEGTKVFFKQKQIQADGSYVLHSLNEKKYKDISDFKNKIVKCVAVVII